MLKLLPYIKNVGNFSAEHVFSCWGGWLSTTFSKYFSQAKVLRFLGITFLAMLCRKHLKTSLMNNLRSLLIWKVILLHSSDCGRHAVAFFPSCSSSDWWLLFHGALCWPFCNIFKFVMMSGYIAGYISCCQFNIFYPVFFIASFQCLSSDFTKLLPLSFGEKYVVIAKLKESVLQVD